MQKFKFKFLVIALGALVSLGVSSCESGNGKNPPSETAALVNGKAIKMEEVERVVKQQTQGQESKLSPLELAQARVQVLQSLIQQEVVFQKAEKEKTIPTDEEVTAEFNKIKTASGKSAEELQKEMEKQGETEATVRDGLKRQLATNKLIEKITSKVEAPKDSEIEAFFKGNPEAFVKKRGVKLAAIVVDPAKNGEGDTTVDEASATLKIKEISAKLNQNIDFATIARENSEDPSRAQGGDLGYISYEELKKNYPQLADGFMNPQVPIGKLVGAPLEGKYYFFKLVERSDKDETRTFETPGVKQEIIEALTNARKNLISQAYIAQAMNEAKIENLLIKKIVDNPNELSGARPASTPDANANTNANSSTANANSNANAAKANANSNSKPETKPSGTAAPKADANSKPANTK